MATPTNPLQSFLWGSGGAQRTPEQVAREREIAESLLQGGMDYSPIAHWLQGAARLGQAGAGAFRNWNADQAEQAGREAFTSRPEYASLFGGAGANPAAGARPAGGDALSAINAVAPSVPSGDTAAYVRQGLVGRGLPEHVADAFLLNMQDESGLNPDINETQPLVPGSRGGYGLYQLTGPRRRAYEQFASERGVPTSDIDAQLDFLMYELQGPESRAAQSILSAQDTPTAAVAIVNDFLRPAPEHRQSRANAYMALGQGGGNVAEPSAATPGAQMALGANPQAAMMPMGGVQSGAMSPQQQMAQPGGGMPMQMPQPPQQQAGYDIASLLSLASDPWANDSERQIVQALIGQQMQQQAQANDPLRQLQIQQAQLQLNQAMNPFQAAPATPEQLAQWGIQPQPGESWTIGQDGLPQQVFAPAAVDPFSGTQVINDQLVTIGDGGPQVIGDYRDPQTGSFDSVTLQLPDGTQRTFNTADPQQLAQANSLVSQGALEIPSSLVTVNTGNQSTPGWEAIDRGFADTYLDWIGGRRADVQAQITNLNNAIGLLESGQAVTGETINLLPREVQAFFNTDGVIAMENVEETVQRSLRETLGAQFTEREGERLIQRAFNPLLPREENIRRVGLLLGKLQEMADARDAMTQFFQENGTLMGYQGPSVSMGSLMSVESQFGDDPTEPQQQPQQSQANPAVFNAPQAGTIEDGYRFRGGDPADPNNWERVQ